jgi:hypothetical protein
MIVFPDGEALSDWERQILEDMEQEMEVSDPQLVAFLFQGDRTPLFALAASLAAAETVVTVAALSIAVAGTMLGLATFGATLWVTSVRAVRGTAAGRQLLDRVP